MNNYNIGLLRAYAACVELILFLCYHVKPEHGMASYTLNVFKLTGVILYLVLNSIRNFKDQQIGFKPLYAVFFISQFLNLFVYFQHYQRPLAVWIFIVIQDIICWYLIFNDYSEVVKE